MPYYKYDSYGRSGEMKADLQAAMDPSDKPLTITEDLADELRDFEKSTGGGPAAVLKALKVSSLIRYTPC